MSDEAYIKWQGGYFRGPRDKLANAVKKGAVEVSQKEYEASKQQGQALAEGAARTLTFGLYDPVMSALGADTEAIDARRETPAGQIGEVAAFAVPVGAPSLIAKGGRAVAKVAGGGVRGLIAKNIAESSAYGLSHLITEETLSKDPDLDGEKLAAGIGMSTLVGAAVEGGVGAAFRGLSKITKKAGTAALKQVAEMPDGSLVPVATGGRAQIDIMAERAGERMVSRANVGDAIEGIGFGAAAGLAVGGSPLASAIAVGGGKVGKWAVNQFVGPAIQRLGKSGQMSKIAESLANRIIKASEMAPGAIEPFKMGLMDAISRHSPEALFQEHARAASDPEYGDLYMASLGLSHESEDEARLASEKLAAYGAVSTRFSEVDRAVGSALDTLQQRPPAPPRAAMSEKEIAAVRESLLKVSLAPEGVGSLVPAEVLHAAPGVGMAAMATTKRGMDYLIEQMPKNPYEGMPEALRPHWQPSPMDRMRFTEALRGVTDPADALANPTTESVAAVKAVYTRLYEDATNKMFERVAELKKPLDYATRQRLALVFGESYIGLGVPEAALIQESFTKNKQQQQQQPMKPDGRQVVSASKNMQAQSERLSNRRNQQ